jgi:hypothetical protein
LASSDNYGFHFGRASREKEGNKLPKLQQSISPPSNAFPNAPFVLSPTKSPKRSPNKKMEDSGNNNISTTNNNEEKKSDFSRSPKLSPLLKPSINFEDFMKPLNDDPIPFPSPRLAPNREKLSPLESSPTLIPVNLNNSTNNNNNNNNNGGLVHSISPTKAYPLAALKKSTHSALSVSTPLFSSPSKKLIASDNVVDNEKAKVEGSLELLSRYP